MTSLMSRFVQEATIGMMERYTLLLVAAIQFVLFAKKAAMKFHFLTRKHEFDLLRKSLDARMNELTSEGVGVEKQSADPLTKDMEETLWDKKIFTRDTAVGLRNIPFWYNCKFYGL